MNKKSLFLMFFSFLIIIAGLYINKVFAVNEPFVNIKPDTDNDFNSERIKNLQAEKESFANGTDANNVEFNNSDIGEDSDLAELLKDAEVAYEEGQKLCDLFGQGIKIVNKYSNTKYSETVTDLRTIDRNTLEAMVSVAELYNLKDAELTIIKTCLAEKYYVITKADPLRTRINAILGIK